MEIFPFRKDTRLLALRNGLFSGLAVLSLLYPVVFVFGISKLSVVVLMYGIVASSLATSLISSGKAGGVYRVVHAGGEFVDEFLGESWGMLVFRERMVNRNAVYYMERADGKKESGKTLQEYFH